MSACRDPIRQTRGQLPGVRKTRINPNLAACCCVLMSPRPNRITIQAISAPGVTPGLVPVLAGGAAAGAGALEERVGGLEDREHQPAPGTPRDVAAARLAPDEFAGPGLDAL